MDLFLLREMVSSNDGRHRLVMENRGIGSCTGIVLSYYLYERCSWRLKKSVHFSSLEG